jgi:hypothetical protein
LVNYSFEERNTNNVMKKIGKFAGIAPDSKHVTEQSEALEHERKIVKESLISAYDKNIATRLKAEVCSMEVNNYNNITKDSCTSKCSCPFGY